MLFGDEVINSERLTVPHYDMKNRGFMLWPLFEIAPTSISPTAPLRRAGKSRRGKTRELVIPPHF
jgi:2-amino-4-hydroxy-6-hydroxymethyldihydropteridine diphosphokinase